MRTDREKERRRKQNVKVVLEMTCGKFLFLLYVTFPV
jgi:hypothetical protein